MLDQVLRHEQVEVAFLVLIYIPCTNILLYYYYTTVLLLLVYQMLSHVQDEVAFYCINMLLY